MSKTASVDQYIKQLREERRAAISALRQLILDNLPAGYEESMTWDMPTYEVPLSRHAETYNGKPLMYAALASQKSHMSIYLTGMYMNDSALERFVGEYKQSGKKLDMGKSCVRFKKLEDLPLKLIAKQIASTPVSEFIRIYEANRR